MILDNKAYGGGNIATVKHQVTDINVRSVGNAHTNPLFDSREYEIELENGTEDRIFANKIAENIYAQLDDEGCEIMKFRDIIDHRKDDSAVTREDSDTQSSSKPNPTTRGWQVLVEWADETLTWMDMKDVKEASPVELAEYAVANRINQEPAFAWWVSYTLKKQNHIISKVKAKYWRTTHKYSVRLPKTVDKALKIDSNAGGAVLRECSQQGNRKGQSRLLK